MKKAIRLILVITALSLAALLLQAQQKVTNNCVTVKHKHTGRVDTLYVNRDTSLRIVEVKYVRDPSGLTGEMVVKLEPVDSLRARAELKQAQKTAASK